MLDKIQPQNAWSYGNLVHELRKQTGVKSQSLKRGMK